MDAYQANHPVRMGCVTESDRASVRLGDASAPMADGLCVQGDPCVGDGFTKTCLMGSNRLGSDHSLKKVFEAAEFKCTNDHGGEKKLINFKKGVDVRSSAVCDSDCSNVPLLPVYSSPFSPLIDFLCADSDLSNLSPSFRPFCSENSGATCSSLSQDNSATGFTGEFPYLKPVIDSFPPELSIEERQIDVNLIFRNKDVFSQPANTSSTWDQLILSPIV